MTKQTPDSKPPLGYEPDEITPAMIEAGADVARELIDYEWAAMSAAQQERILTGIFRAMEAKRIKGQP